MKTDRRAQIYDEVMATAERFASRSIDYWRNASHETWCDRAVFKAALCAAIEAYGRDCADRAREECATIVRNAAVYGCACSDRETLARLICAGTEGEGSHV